MIALETESLLAAGGEDHYENYFFRREQISDAERERRRTNRQEAGTWLKNTLSDGDALNSYAQTVRNVAGLFQRAEETGPEMPSDYTVAVGPEQTPPDDPPKKQVNYALYVGIGAVALGLLVVVVNMAGKRNKTAVNLTPEL